MPTDWWSFLLPLAVVLVWFAWTRWFGQDSPQHTAAVTATLQRLLKPRPPTDCPACRQLAATATGKAASPTRVTPCREVKSRRGAPKRIDTQGFACPTPTCRYYRITDAQVHALLGDGVEGKTERRETLRCPPLWHDGAPATTTLWVTPLEWLKTASQRVSEVLTALAEGLSVSAAVRVFGHRHATITSWLTRAGAHSATLHKRFFQNLSLPHLQLDELRSRLRNRTHALWLWVVVEKLTKLVPVLHHPEGTRCADPGRCPSGGPRAVWATRHRLSAGLHQRRSEPGA
jgi:hypothetical protein